MIYPFHLIKATFTNAHQKKLANIGEAAVDGREDNADADSSVFVKYNRMLHGRKTERGRKRDTLTIKFLKKYIHYAKHRIQPELTDEVTMLLIFCLMSFFIPFCKLPIFHI